MNLTWVRTTALFGSAAFLLALPPRINAAVSPSQPSAFAQDRDDWNRPPDEWNEMQRRGFHDGVEGARKDVGNHRRPDVDNREEYRRPNVPPEMWGAYREGFRRGYDVALSHLMGGGPDWRAQLPERPWDAAPNEFDQLRRQGFQDGIEGARKDFDNHRRPDVENREEYRHPHLPDEQREAYREGFRHGYQVAVEHFMGEHDRDRDRDRDHDHDQP